MTQETASNNINYQEAKSWPWLEAQKLNQTAPNKDLVIFETGYGPSGPPHIGTFAEVFRTAMVKNAFEEMTGRKAKLIVFSDDMDGLRKFTWPRP